MADLDSINTVEGEPIKDPIADAQNAVMEVKALLECIDTVVDGQGSSYRHVDLVAALAGVIRLIDKVGDDLDPRQFRAAVLASAEQVAHV